jgi:hypothetical protein
MGGWGVEAYSNDSRKACSSFLLLFHSMACRILFFLAAQFYTLSSEDLVTFLLIPRNFQLQFPFQKRETFPENIPGIYFFKEKSQKKVVYREV